MKTLITLLALLLICTSTFTLAQPKIQFDTTIYDYGSVVESNSAFIAKYWFTNTGTEPLIIGNLRTSDGGLAPGRWPKEPILPGKRDSITLLYHGRRIGPINKTGVVTSNAVNNPSVVLRVKGEVLFKKTSIKVSMNEADMRTIPFGEVDTISFIVTNTGNEPLHFNFLDNYPTPLIDLFYRRLSVYNPLNLNDIPSKEPIYNEIVAAPNEMILVQICLRNNYGNVGPTERCLYFKYNSDDTLKYTIKVNYVGAPVKEKVYEENYLYEYKEGKLIKRTAYYYNGDFRAIDHFRDGHLINSIKYDYPSNGDRTEYFYKNDLMIEKVTQPNDK